uniref:Uncharacterized protein n=1 Tax=Arundo donax TaxID=35708 RepID=A0A0A9AMU8_ARUDO
MASIGPSVNPDQLTARGCSEERRAAGPLFLSSSLVVLL